MKKFITRSILVLSIVSLFTDMASEMLYPVMPIYLKSIGFSIVFIGILEGIAEAMAGLSKGYFGKLSDSMGKRLPFVQAGYTLSALAKPLLVLFMHPIWVLLIRSMDRLGKGLRTGARDALLSDEATPETKGKVFGFHRSMDTIGAVLGPTIALLYLYYHPSDYTSLFLIALFPGIVAIAATFLLKEKSQPTERQTKPEFFSFLYYWKTSEHAYKKVVIGLILFALINSSDVFLLLKAKEAGMRDSNLILYYIFYNLVYVIFAFPLGQIADKIGMKAIFILGLFIFSTVYMGMAYATTNMAFASLFFLYGIYAASTEGIAKAWLSNLCEKKHTATAIGFYAGFQSIAALFASTLAGMLWYSVGSSITFIVSGGICLVLCIYFMVGVKSIKLKQE